VRADSLGEGRGSTFTISLPVMSAPLNAEVRGNAVAKTAPSLQGVRVLLVEDERDARDLAKLALEQSGAHVTAVSSASDALASLASMAPAGLADVIVSDIATAGQDGDSLIRKVRALSPEQRGEIPALSVTGYASPNDVRRALTAGFQMHMAKPVDPQALVAAVARLVSRG